MVNPLVTVTLYTYNQEKYVREAVLSIIRQSYQPLEIIISDDCSTDSTVDVIKDTLCNENCEHKVTLNVNTRNIGIIGHVNSVVNMAAGEFIVGAAGDDVSSPDRVKVLVNEWRTKRVSSVFSNAMCMDSSGKRTRRYFENKYSGNITIKEMIDQGHTGVLGATLSYEKKAFIYCGDLPSDGPYEDQIIPFKAALNKGLYYFNEDLVDYRVHGKNVSEWIRSNQSSSIDWFKIRMVQVSNSVKRYSYWIKYLKLSNKFDCFLPILEEKIALTRLEYNMLNSASVTKYSYIVKLLRRAKLSKEFIRCLLLLVSSRAYRLVLKKRAKIK